MEIFLLKFNTNKRTCTHFKMSAGLIFFNSNRSFWVSNRHFKKFSFLGNNVHFSVILDEKFFSVIFSLNQAFLKSFLPQLYCTGSPSASFILQRSVMLPGRINILVSKYVCHQINITGLPIERCTICTTQLVRGNLL